MGFPVEGFPPEICKQYVNEMIPTGHVRGRRRGLFSFGQYTDDSQLARELLQSYMRAIGLIHMIIPITSLQSSQRDESSVVDRQLQKQHGG